MCPDGGDITFPDRALPLQDRVLTCGDLLADLQPVLVDVLASTRSGHTLCKPSMDISALNTIIDLPAYCGCPNYPAPELCSMCGGNNDVDVNKQIPGAGTGNGASTCGDVAELAMFVTNQAFCDNIYQNFGPGCCKTQERCNLCPPGKIMQAPDNSVGFDGGKSCREVNNQISFLSPDQCDSTRKELYVAYDVETVCQCRSPSRPCSLCKNGRPVGEPEKTVNIGGMDMTCQKINSDLGYFMGESQECFDSRSQYSNLPFDLESFCGCPDVSPPDICSLCNGGVVNEDWTVLQTGKNCDYFEDFARHVVDDNYCDSQVAAIGSQCCLERAFEPIDTSDPDSTAAVGSFGGYKLISYLIFGIGVGLAMDPMW